MSDFRSIEWDSEGFLKVHNNPKACIEWWRELSETKRNALRSIPNFDADKLFEIFKKEATQ